ncbi:hypothetical protein AVEN_101129-1 [Araneus ventricosus]|uniref:Uncharacterized protein n=1 Tax=Araneus ventricosus TaxID=182803 RepID=A0A4Y2DCH5_ARAVE|nr:hypothetical protein AVEN_101129-1 [Araneus ventricosus]
MYGVNGPTRRIMENEGPPANAQETTQHWQQETTDPHRPAAQTDNNSQATKVQHFETSNTNCQQTTNNDNSSALNSAQPTDPPPPARTADETPKSLQMINTPLLWNASAVLSYSARQAVASHGNI